MKPLKNVNYKNNHYHWDLPVGTIDVIREVARSYGEGGDYGYLVGNVIKYVFRAKKKNNLEDLHKAKVYLDWLIEAMEFEQSKTKDNGEEQDNIDNE